MLSQQPLPCKVQGLDPYFSQDTVAVNQCSTTTFGKIWKSKSVSDERSKPMSSRIFSYSKRVPDQGNSTEAWSLVSPAAQNMLITKMQNAGGPGNKIHLDRLPTEHMHAHCYSRQLSE